MLGKELINEGIEKGIKEGIKKIVEHAIKKGYDDEKINNVCGVDIEEIRAIRKGIRNENKPITGLHE